jgi:hypothetical protein
MVSAARLVLAREARSRVMGIMLVALVVGWVDLSEVMRGSALDGLRAQR